MISPRRLRHLTCGVCLQKFPSERTLQEHFDKENNHGFYKGCSSCGNVFKSPPGYEYHIKAHHGILHKQGFVTNLSCVVCNSAFRSEESLRDHFKEVNNHGYLKSCEKCGKVFKSFPGYKCHMQMQHGKKEGSMRCAVCGISVYNKHLLRQHMVKHNLKTYSCKFCKKKFKRENYMLSHQKACTVKLPAGK